MVLDASRGLGKASDEVLLDDWVKTESSEGEGSIEGGVR